MSDYIQQILEEFKKAWKGETPVDRPWNAEFMKIHEQCGEWFESFLSQAIERVEKEVREEEGRKIKNELTGNCTCYCHRLGSQEICEECQDRYGLLSSQEEDLVEGNIDKAMKSFGLEEKWFCTKHQLNHGQKYKSCVGNKEENKPKPEERIAKNFAKLEQKRTHAAEKRRELAETGERSECTEHEGPCFHKLEEEKKEELIDGHKKTCRWIRTTEDECDR